MLNLWSIQKLLLGNCEITTVPSTHYNVMFADKVNRLFYEEQFDAVAVELSESVCSQVCRFISSLKKDEQTGLVSLPLMMGIQTKNRLLLPSQKARVMEYQRLMRRSLSDIPKEALREDLGVYQNAIAPISPTDSIIEAVRCSIERDLPLFGVDLSEFALFEYPSSFVGDPYLYHESSNGPVTINLDESGRYINERREYAMAARLKEIAKKYSKVLFVCGAGHAKNTMENLKRKEILPAPVKELRLPIDDSEAFLCILNPIIASHHIRPFPFFAPLYEKHRKMRVAGTSVLKELSSKIIQDLICEKLEAFKHYYFISRSDKTVSDKVLSADAQRYEQLVRFVNCFHLLRGQIVFEMNSLLHCTSAMMSEEFVTCLLKFLMDVPWINSDEFKNVPRMTEYCEGCYSKADEQKNIEVPRNKHVNDFEFDKRETHYLHTWRPWESLLLSKCQEAFEISVRVGKEKQSEIFSGSMCDGIDFKTSIRESAKGGENLYVYREKRKDKADEAIFADGFPFVWIFNTEADSKADWSYLFHKLEWILSHAKNKVSFQKFIRKHGDSMLSTLGYAVSETPCHENMNQRRFFGYAQYSPICFSNAQFARWVEISRGKRNPILGFNETYMDLIEKVCSIIKESPKNLDWKDILVLLGLAYADGKVVVIKPHDYQISEKIKTAARRLRVLIFEMDIEKFDLKTRETLATSITAPALKNEPWAIFDSWVEEAMGQKQYQMDKLIPVTWKNFGRY